MGAVNSSQHGDPKNHSATGSRRWPDRDTIKLIGFLIGGGLISTLPVILSLWLGIVLFPQFQQLFRQFTWPQVEGVITSSAVVRSSDATYYRAQITYEYVVNGMRFVGHRASMDGTSSSDWADAEAIVQRYPVDTTVSVHYDPANPEMAVLEPTPEKIALETNPGGAVVIGALIAPLVTYDVVFLFVSLAIARAVMAPLLRRNKHSAKPSNTTTR